MRHERTDCRGSQKIGSSIDGFNECSQCIYVVSVNRCGYEREGVCARVKDREENKDCSGVFTKRKRIYIFRDRIGKKSTRVFRRLGNDERGD